MLKVKLYRMSLEVVLPKCKAKIIIKRPIISEYLSS